jgi:hypothetical protein
LAFGQDDGEFNIFNTDRQLSAVQTATTMLGHLNEKKSLVYFACGLRLNGSNNQAQLKATTKGSPGGIGMYSGGSAMVASTNFQRSQDTLYALGADTGGKALLDNNDLSMGIVQAQKAI